MTRWWKALFIIMALGLLVDAIGSVIAQFHQAFFPYQFGRVCRVGVGIIMLYYVARHETN